MRARLLVALLVGVNAFLACGCGSQLYRNTIKATFKGNLDVRWYKNDLFVFIPDTSNPLTFTNDATGDSIIPGKMYTDGGPIPRFLWGIEGYSPWGYAPAYIIHDWLFEAHHCGYEPDNKYTFVDSANILAQGLKAIMEDDLRIKNFFVFDSVYLAVKTPIAKRLWEQGECKPPLADEREIGDLIMRIHFE